MAVDQRTNRQVDDTMIEGGWTILAGADPVMDAHLRLLCEKADEAIHTSDFVRVLAWRNGLQPIRA